MTKHAHTVSGKTTSYVTDPDLSPYALGTELTKLAARVAALEIKVASLAPAPSLSPAPGYISTFTTVAK